MKTLSVCATYGRIPYLGRMLSSFINQNYDDKHLVIVNDDKNVELCCNRKDVTIINCNQRLLISEKRNIGINVGHHDIIFPWDDDDIYLPDRLWNHVSKYTNEVNSYRNIPCYVIYGDKFIVSNSNPNAISYRKSEWFKVGGYAQNVRGEDEELLIKLNNGGLYTQNCDQCMDYVYQFGGVNYHLSDGYFTPERLEEKAFKQLESLNLVGKKFWIQPDFEQYNNVMLLKKMFDNDKKDLTIKHVGDAKIDISHLL